MTGSRIRPPWHSATIAGKLVSWFLIITLVPLVALLVLTQQLSNGLMRQTALDHLRALADEKSRRIESFTADHKRNIQSMVQIPLVAEALEDLVDPPERAIQDSAFRPSLRKFAALAGYQDLLLVAPSGEVVFSLGPRLPAGSLLTRVELANSQLALVVERARALGTPQMSSFEIHMGDDHPVAFIAAPVRFGEIAVGIAVAEITNADLWAELTDHSGLGETGEVVLGERDDNGILLLTRRERHIPGEGKPDYPDYIDPRTGPPGQSRPLIEAVAGTDGAGDAIDYRGVEVLAVWRHLPSIRCGMVVKIDRAEALSLVSKQRQLVVAIALLTTAGVVVLALFASRSLTRPIRALTAIVRRMGSGDLNPRVAVEGDDELAELAVAFNRMTTDLRDVYATVEDQVRQRTQELESSNAELGRARDELRKYFQAVECSPVSVIITDTEGVVEYINPHFTITTGFSAEEAVGCRPSLVASGQTPPEVYEGLWSTIKAGGEWRGEFLNRRKNGSLYWEAASISPVRQPGGAITHFVAIEDDISSRKETVEQLRTAKEAAEAASIAKSEFLAVMSHEIRTPMNGILGMTQLLLDTPLSGVQRDYLETIRHSGVALLTLLNDILDFSKLEAGRVELESVDFDLTGTVEQVISLLSARAREKRLEVTAEIDPRLPRYLCGDQARLRQVLLNLLGNAVKFTENGGVRIVVEPDGPGSRDECRLRFAVVDTGIGIAEEVRDRLFQSFSQADSSITRRYGGSGLGLAICRRLIELHGGRIGLDSSPGKGSSFWFTVVYRPGKAPANSTAMGLPNTSALPRMRILLAEDNAVNRKVAIALLGKWGHRVTAVVDGRQAVEAVQAEPFDVVLMDVQMPEMDGLEATRCIRALSGPASRLPIIALTANAMRGDEVRCLEAGMDDYLSKPIEQDRLYAALERVCQRRALSVEG